MNTGTNKPRSLLALNSDMHALEEIIGESGGELTDESLRVIQDWIGDLKAETNNKADAYLGLVREFELRADAVRAEAKRLAERATVSENAAKNLRARLQWFMEQNGIKSIDTGRFRVSVSANGGAAPLVIDDEGAIPENYYDHPPVLNRAAVRAALEGGIEIPGVRIGERGTSLRIR